MSGRAGHRPPKRLRRIVGLAKQHGWSFELTSRGHIRLRPPADLETSAVVFSSTPSDPRGDKNAIALLRRAGVPVPRK